MKKTYLFFITLICFISGFGQDSMAPCNEFNPSNAFENGLEYSTGNGLKIANDLTVTAGKDFELHQIIYNSFHTDFETIVSVDVVFYEDNGGLPGAVIGSELNVVPTSQLDYGTVSFAISRVVLDLTPFVFLGQVDEDTTYWVELHGTSTAGPLYWETTTAAAHGYPSAQSENGIYSIVDENYDGVYEWFGECENILGITDSLKNLISVYPNPVSEVLNISIPNGIDVLKISLIDILGNIVFADTVNTNLNLDGLSKGVYFLRILTSEGDLTKKIIKK